MLAITKAALTDAAGTSTTGLNDFTRRAAVPTASALRTMQATFEGADVIFQTVMVAQHLGVGLKAI